MAIQDIIARISGRNTRITPVVVSAGAADGGKVAALDQTTGKWHPSMIPDREVRSVVAAETMVAGRLVNLFNDAGALKARYADNSNGRRAHAYIADNVDAGNSVIVKREDSITGLSGLTPGARYYLGTAGALTLTPVTAAGTIDQYVGFAESATELAFEPDDEVVNP